MSELKTGERWYVQYPEAVALTEVTITDVTEKTVMINPQPDHLRPMNTRYERGTVRFIERILQ